MSLNTPMLRRGALRLLKGRNIELKTLASRSWELCEASVSAGAPAIFLPGMLDKVVALSPWRRWDLEEQHIFGTPIEHAPTVGHLIENVDLVGAFIYKRGAKAHFGFGSESLFTADLPGRESRLRASLVTSDIGSSFFGHYLLDDFPLALIPKAGDDVIAMAQKHYEHGAGYREAMGLTPVPTVLHARIRELTYYTDFGQNHYKEERYRKLRADVRRLNPALRAKPAGVYIKRGKAGEPRAIINEDEVATFLSDRGFEIIEPDQMSAREIVQRTMDARIVAGVEGSQLSHAIYTIADDGRFLVLQPPDRFAMAYKEFADRLGLRFGFVVGDPGNHGFSIALDELARTLEQVDIA